MQPPDFAWNKQETFMARYAFTTASIALMALLSFAPAQAATQGTVIIQSGPSERVYQPAPVRVYQTAPTYQVIPAPPPPRYEATPRHRRGKVWEEGHWEWRGNRHQWVKGKWVQARNGYQYRQPQWVERDGHWEMQRGRWARDDDGDGYSNRNDRDRDGDGVANRNDRDRDGDGVPNRRDRQPDNSRRN